METWFIIVLSLCVAALLKAIISLLLTTKAKNLPPGPGFTAFPIIGNLLWIRKSLYDVIIILKQFKLKYGPIYSLRIGSRVAVFIGSHAIAHTALIENGAVFSDRPPPPLTSKILGSNQHNISSAGYGATWRLLRRNLTSEILHPSRVKSYSHARKWVLNILLRRLSDNNNKVVRVVDDFQYAMFCLLVLMCFGDKLNENEIKEIEKVQRQLLLNLQRFNLLNIFPKFGKVLFYKRWNEFLQLRLNQQNVLLPLIESRIEKSKQTLGDHQEEFVTAYVDTLLKLQLPEEGNRKLSLDEILSLCSEFLNAGTDTTTTALQWIMANLVKDPEIQGKLYDEIVSVVGDSPVLSEEGGKMAVVEEDDLQRMSYLKAVVLESLRLHPPGQLVLPHTVTKEVELAGYVIPKDARINFLVAEMGRDPSVWDDPMKFKPERFLNKNGDDAFDITGSRGIKMMPFGAGRRICPGLNLALLHLEYFVANLVWYFEWKVPDDVPVDLSEKFEFTAVMKNPLLANIVPRAKS